jgi:hypothetical protein
MACNVQWLHNSYTGLVYRLGNCVDRLEVVKLLVCGVYLYVCISVGNKYSQFVEPENSVDTASTAQCRFPL